jgi:hypothetical protein
VIGLAVVALVALAPAPVVAATPVRYDDHVVVTAWVDDEAELALLTRYAQQIWTERPGPGVVEALVSPWGMQRLATTAIEHQVRTSDVQGAIDRERERLAARPDPSAGGDAWFSDFRDLSEIQDKVAEWAVGDPERVTVETIGESLEGRPIALMRMGSQSADAPAVLFTGTMHAREWLATMSTMCVANTFATSTDPVVLDLLDRIAVLVVPMINPDGYVISWTSDRYWRKNARDGYGVDLNRNWDYQWAVVGSSSNPYDENFHGDAPFSEPETVAIRDLVVAETNLVAHIDFHSYSQLILRPWGFTYDAPPDEPVLAMLGQSLSDAMWDATSTDYPSIHAAELYPAAGAVDDWVYGERGIMGFTIEMRGDDFVVPPSQIDPACRENVAAALALATWAAADAPAGDDDGGGGDEGGETGHEPPADDDGDAGSDGNADDDASDDAADDANDDDASDDDANDDGDGTNDDDDVPDALPPTFGLGTGDPAGCGCASSHPTGATLWLVTLASWRRRRRAPSRAHDALDARTAFARR